VSGHPPHDHAASGLRSAPCERRALASSPFSLVELCSCGSVHLTIGAVTMRLHADALPELARALGDATRELSLQQLVAAHHARPGRAVS